MWPWTISKSVCSILKLSHLILFYLYNIAIRIMNVIRNMHVLLHKHCFNSGIYMMDISGCACTARYMLNCCDLLHCSSKLFQSLFKYFSMSLQIFFSTQTRYTNIYYFLYIYLVSIGIYIYVVWEKLRKSISKCKKTCHTDYVGMCVCIANLISMPRLS